MNRSHRLLLLLLAGLGHALLVPASNAQEAAEEEGEQRVQYQLVLPDEKTPENVKPEEHNPFESESEAQDRMSPGDTEENRVRDLLLRLKVAGTKRMADGRMRVLLGNIILETGKPVPSVLPDQQVELKVKNITAEAIELAWQEKRATGLPPKLMIIPINISPRVRYQMLGQVGEDGTEAKGGVNATMEMPLRSLMAREKEAQTTPVASSPPAPAQEPQALPAELILDDPPAPAKAPTSAPGPAPAPAVVTAPAPAAAQAEEPAPGATTPPAVMEEKEVELAEQPVPVAPVPPPIEPPPAAAPAPSSSTPPPSPAVEGLVRMLFGNPVPKPK
ncbi:MAG: hypothetical protein ACO1TE_18450 [Prosthecobacter sp.]